MKRASCCAVRVTRLTDDSGSRWLFEAGIGEDRAVLVANGNIIEARIERHGGLKVGSVVAAKLVKKLSSGKRAIVEFQDGGGEGLLSSIPDGLSEGQSLRVIVTREAVDERSRFKWPLVKATDAELSSAPSLIELISADGYPVQNCYAHETDHFAAFGWHDLVEEARSGHIEFPGGSLLIALSPAMTLIDVDGELPPTDLADAAARASALAIRRLGLQGSIGIDFPASATKSSRKKIADIFDMDMHGDFERTAVNGFGFMQIVTRRVRPSLPELLQRQRMRGHALELLRMAERSRKAGALNLTAHPAIIQKLEKQADWMEELRNRSGRDVLLHTDPKLAIGGSHVS